jgi:hypothetical protein
VLVDLGRHSNLHQPGAPLFDEDGFGSLQRRRLVRQAFLALLAFVQRVDLGDGTRDPFAQALLLAGRQCQRAHHEAALLPARPLPGLILGALLDRVGTPTATGSSVAQSPVGVWERGRQRRLQHPVGDGLKQVEGRFRHLRG